MYTYICVYIYDKYMLIYMSYMYHKYILFFPKMFSMVILNLLKLRYVDFIFFPVIVGWIIWINVPMEKIKEKF